VGFLERGVKEQVPFDLTPDMLPRISKMGNLFLHFRKLTDFIEEKVKELRQHCGRTSELALFCC